MLPHQSASKALSIRTTSYIKSAIYSFKNSILFYPILLSSGSIALFAITSRIDETLGQVPTIDLPILNSLLFAGSPHAARSILSTIAAGWATILGVAFSVTLISLQLSITRHTSEVMDEFENDKLNQVMLGWFVSTVIYSLLVLKTVRTGEDELVQAFTPVIGVNVAVFLAIIALFIFISFLHNVSKYLKPPLLIDKIQGHVIRAIEKYGQRQVDRNASFITAEPGGYKLLEVRSPMQGVLRRIRLDEMRKQIAGNTRLQGIWIEFQIAQGGDVRKGSTIATVYARSAIEESDKSMIEQSVINAADISQNRDLLTDPMYGVEILRNIAIKSINQSDINPIKACIGGLFVILAQAFRVSEIQTKPVTITAANNGLQIGTVVHLNEEPLYKIILAELATIHKACLEHSVALGTALAQYKDEYRLAALDLLDANMMNQFVIFTEWFSDAVFAQGPALHDAKKLPIINSDQVLREFRKRLAESYPYALEIFDVHTKRSFVSEA